MFTSVALFAMLTGPLNAFPWVINGLIESLVSVRRLSEFLSLNQFQRDDFFTKIGTVDKTRTKDVVISNGNFGIQLNDGQPDSFMLRDINLTIKKGEVLGIIGKVGQGKTTLLKAILGELKKQSGTISVSDPHMGIGYAAQEPWLIQGSIRHNILFGKEYNHVWYEKIIDACALKQDLLEMPAGDGTEVGENGCMLSGGQKARVALARTVYQNKDIILIDDIFSSVDTPVGSHIYNKCILQLLRHKTRIIVTHHLRFLAGASTVIVINQGKIVESGDPKNLLNKTDFEKELDWNEDEKEEEKQDKKIASPEEQELLEAESRETGVVKLDIYKKYWSSVGNVLSPVILLSLLLMQASRNFTDVWLAEWVSKDEHNASLTKGEEDIDFYLSIYGSIAGLNTIFSLIRAFLFAYGGVCAAYTVHKKLFEVVMKAKVVFFDCTPVGRILNRFSSDLYTVDDSLPFILNIFLAQLFGVIGPLVVCMYSVPWIVIILVPLAFVYHDIQKKYRPASRDLKRIGSVSLSPIYSHFSETLTGHPTIRAMKEINRFSQQNEEMVENNQKAQYAGIAAAQWLELRLQLIGCAVVTGICVISVIQHHTDSINPGYVGLAISYALGITGKLSDLVKTFTETEKELVAVERCYQYIKRTPMEQESPGITITPRNWPSGGVVGFEEVRLKYREGLPYALNCLDFKTRQQEKVGIVGRTGSGKSSIFQALFRFVDISGGNISIDGVKIHTLDLKELRRAITIIPQDPFLFSGTIRENLDPLGKYGDVNLWESLHRARLEPVIRAMGGLDALVQERGRSFSVGERQLICLARAMLSPAKVLINYFSTIPFS